MKTYLILHNVRSVHNVGAIFRTAECVGISKIYLIGYTPTPLDRFGRERTDFSKSALGAEKLVAWKQYKNISTLLKKLKQEGVKIVAVEQSPKATDYKDVKVRGNTAFVFGNEISGLSNKILDKADVISEIPLRGKKESLNVSVAVGVFLFRVLNV